MTTHPGIFAWRIPWTEEPGKLQFIGFQRDGHDWSDWAFALSFIWSWFALPLSHYHILSTGPSDLFGGRTSTWTQVCLNLDMGKWREHNQNLTGLHSVLACILYHETHTRCSGSTCTFLLGFQQGDLEEESRYGLEEGAVIFLGFLSLLDRMLYHCVHLTWALT